MEERRQEDGETKEDDMKEKDKASTEKQRITKPTMRAQPSPALRLYARAMLWIESRPPITTGQIIGWTIAIPSTAAAIAALAAPSRQMVPALFLTLISLTLTLLLVINLIRLLQMTDAPASPALIIAMREAIPAVIWQSVQRKAEATRASDAIITRSDLFTWHKWAIDEAREVTMVPAAKSLAEAQREAIG
jgi:hypothetical protein